MKNVAIVSCSLSASLEGCDLCSISSCIDNSSRPGCGVSVNSSLEAAELSPIYSGIINSELDLASFL